MTGASKEILCCFGVPVGTEAGWAGSDAGEDSPREITRGLFAGEIGVPRLLDLFYSFNMQTTWFIAAHAIETFPAHMRMVADAGHEIGLLGSSPAHPVATNTEEEEDVLRTSIDVVTGLSGTAPRGYAAPTGEHSGGMVQLLMENGFAYDTSPMDNDFHPFYARGGDSGTKIDSSRSAASSMHPLTRGEETDLVGIGANWSINDRPPMVGKKAPSSHAFVNPRDLEQIWRDQFDWVYRHYDYAVYPITIHPDLSGRPHALMMLERFIAHVDSHPGARWATFAEVADDFVARYPRLGHDRPESVRTVWEHGAVGE